MKRNVLILILALFAAITYCAQTERIATSGLEIEFDSTTGALVAIASPGGSNILAPLPGDALWEISLGAGDSTAPRSLRPAQARRFAVSRKEGALHLSWDGFGIEGVPDLMVEVRVAPDGQSADTVWSIAVEHLASGSLTQVRFPRLPHLSRAEGERIAVPQWMGQETSIPRQLVNALGKSGERQEWPYPGHLSLQCMAYTRAEGPGLYFASNDPDSYRKSFAMFGDGSGGLGIEQTHLPETTGGAKSSWRLPYDCIVGGLRGDWFAAAERYRAWGSQQDWARKSRLRRGLVPQWARECDLWVWNRGRSENVLKPAGALQERFRQPLGVFWHWWHNCPYDTGFPEYFPPREGMESFSSALGKAHEQGIHAIVYMNQRLWGMTTRSWSDRAAATHAVKGPDGKIHPEIYNIFTKQPCASMCMGTSFWRDTYAGLAERACGELGVDGVYMDQACSSLACYDSSHGHPIGGGRYWVDGFRKMEADIRSRCAVVSSTTVLAGEGVAECWLPHLDLMLSLEVSRERYQGVGDWEVIPFFHAVYHGDGLIYGNYSSLAVPPYDDLWPPEYAPKEPFALLPRTYSRQFALEQARSFVWGQQLTVANFQASQLKERDVEIEQVLRLARLRKAESAFLRDGVMLAFPRIDLPQTTIPISRLSIYAGRNGEAVRSYQKSVAQVVGSAWRARDGRVGLVFANATDAEINFPLHVQRQAWSLPESATLVWVDDSGERPLGSWNSGERGPQIILPARGACVLEFRSNDQGAGRPAATKP